MKIAFIRFVLALSYIAQGLVATLTLGFYFPPSMPLKVSTWLARERHAVNPQPLRVVR
jgi:hypothetical protein